VLSIFRTNQLSVSVLLIFYAALLHISGFFIAHDWDPVQGGFLAEMLFRYTGQTTVLAKVLVIVLLFMQAFLINFLEINQRLGRELTQYPGLFFIIISSLSPEFLHLSPLHIANFFYLLALIELIGLNKKESASGKIFNAGFWLGIASLFYFSYLILLLVFFIGLGKLRALKIRELLMVLTGMLVPFFLMGTLMYWKGQLSEFLAFFGRQTIGGPDKVLFSGIEGRILLIVFALFLFLSFFSYNQFIYKAVMAVRKRVEILFWALIIPFLSFFIFGDLKAEHLLIFALPLGYLTGLKFQLMKKNIGGFLHFLILLGIIFWQLKPLLFP